MQKCVWIMIGMLIGAGCLCDAYADTITFTTFDISGTVTPVSPKTGTTFFGTLVLATDLDFMVTEPVSGELNFPDLPTLELFGGGFGPPANASLAFADTEFFPINASLSFIVPTPFSLDGFTGGTFSSSGDSVTQQSTTFYQITSFSITPETAAVPEPSSSVVVLGFVGLIFVARRRRLATGR